VTPVTEAPPLSAVPSFEDYDPGSDGTHLICGECGTEFVHTGPGRKPRNCPDHRRRNTASGGSRTRAQRPAVALLGQAVTMNLRTIGSIVAMANQYDGQVIMAGAPIFGNACSNVAEHDPRFRKWLEGSATGIVYGELIAAACIIALPILANHGILPERVMENVATMFGNNAASAAATSAGVGNAVPHG
jgi:hypothetical protein